MYCDLYSQHDIIQGMKFSGFDWDEGNIGHCRKHGLTIPEIERALNSGALVILSDVKHSGAEQRQIAAGALPNGERIFVAFTLRQKDGKTLLRPISARRMHEGERRRYGQETPPSGDG